MKSVPHLKQRVSLMRHSCISPWGGRCFRSTAYVMAPVLVAILPAPVQANILGQPMA